MGLFPDLTAVEGRSHHVKHILQILNLLVPLMRLLVTSHIMVQIILSDSDKGHIYSKSFINWTNCGKGQSELSENPSYPRDFFSHSEGLLTQLIEIHCIMNM